MWTTLQNSSRRLVGCQLTLNHWPQEKQWVLFLREQNSVFLPSMSPLPRFQGARPDHVRDESWICCYCRWNVTRSPPIGKRIWALLLSPFDWHILYSFLMYCLFYVCITEFVSVGSHSYRGQAAGGWFLFFRLMLHFVVPMPLDIPGWIGVWWTHWWWQRRENAR